ncbi:MAG: hypothetical protein IJ802_03005 [Kiritimatiellae bacterium]|nr:hypothetical protein [Kiritimatiellia bacterium]
MEKSAMFFALAAACCALAAERPIPGAQGTNVNPYGDRIDITTSALYLNGEVKVPGMGEIH